MVFMRLLHLLIFFIICFSASPSSGQNKFKGVIAANVKINENKYQTIIIDSTGNSRILEENDNRSYLSFHPDGNNLLISTITYIKIDTMDLRNYNLKEIKNSKYIFDRKEFPKPTVNGDSIIFRTTRTWIRNIDGTSKSKLFGQMELGHRDQMQFSPDGVKIIYTKYRPWGITKGEIWEYDFITRKEQEIYINLGSQADGEMNLSCPGYSPDGKYIVFFNERFATQQNDIFFKDLFSQDIYLFTQNEMTGSVVWSPVSEMLLVYNNKLPSVLYSDRVHTFNEYRFIESFSNFIKTDNIQKLAGIWSPDGNNIAFYIENDGNNEVFITENTLINTVKILSGIEIFSFCWGGYPRPESGSEIKISGKLIRPDVFKMIVLASVIIISAFLFAGYCSFKKYLKYLYLLPGVIVLITANYLFKDSGLVFCILFTFSYSIFLIAGKKAGNYFNKEIKMFRDELLINLLEFGHSGTASRNINQIIFCYTNMIKDNKIDYFYEKKLVKYILDFKLNSKTSISNLSRMAKKSLFYKHGALINKSLKKYLAYSRFINNSSHISKNLSIIKQLQNTINDLESAVNRNYSCNIYDISASTVQNFQKETYDKDVDLIHITKGEIFYNFAKIDKDDFVFILSNLIENSFNAMEGSDKKSINIHLSSNQTRYFVRVSDTGKGIEKEKWDLIFLPTYSEFKGTGFGLYHSIELLAKYKGHLEILSSEPGKGTKFLLTLRIPGISDSKTSKKSEL